VIRPLRLILTGPLLVLAVVGLAACTSSSSHSSTPSQLNDQNGTGPYAGAGLDPAQPRPAFTLTDTAGQQFAFGTETAGHPTLLYFGYTNCPDVCPETMTDVRIALTALPVALQKETDVVFVSTDVKHDTAPVISEWLGNFSDGTSAHFIGLRGTQTQIDTAQAAAHITLAEDDGQTHSAQVLLYGVDNYARVTFLQSTTEAQQIQHDLPLVAKS
jgi:protein SCO1